MRFDVVGRDEERASLRAFFERELDGPHALVLEGEAGIGKSTLWLTALSDARERGFRVLSTQTAEAEQALAFVGLGDLLEGVESDVLAALQPPRRHALQVALLLDEAADPINPRSLGVATRDALEVLARAEPLVLAVDDVQWLDPSSTAALAFALRRTRAPLRLLLARRVAEGIERSGLERSLAADSVEILRVGSMSVGALQALLRDRLLRTFSRPVLLRIHEASGGNPFYGLELAQALGADLDPTKPIPVPETLEGLVLDRLGGLPAETRSALALVSAIGTSSVELLDAAGVPPTALVPAVDARVVESSGGEIRFTHPLLSSVLYQELSEDERRSVHQRVAGVVEDSVARARHLALATSEPDAAIAAVVDEAAGLAAGRGAMAAAIELREHALRLTPLDERDDVFSRMIAAAKAYLAVAEVDRARALSAALLEQAPPGIWRARALMLSSEEHLGYREDVRLHREALIEAEGDPALQAQIHQWLGWTLRFTEGPYAAEEHARAALEIAEKLDDDALRAGGLSKLSAARLHLGEPDAVSLGEEGYALACRVADPDGVGGAPAASRSAADLLADVVLAHSSTLIWTTQLDRACELLREQYDTWSERDEGLTAQILWRLALVELARGRLPLALDYAERAREINRQYGDSAEDVSTAWAVALIEAHRGELARARELAEEALRLAEGSDPWFAAYVLGTLGLVDAWGDDPHRAVERFSAAEDARRAVGSLEPNLARWRADHVETLLELGRIDEAIAVLDPWEADAARLERGAVLAQAARCRGLVAAARGHVAQAAALFEDAIRKHEAVGDPIGRARSLLALGVVRRRGRQRRASREAIEEAITLFEECGAAGWAEKARAELGSIGGRRREEGLTPAERRVAALVAEGRTNREVAAALFLGERTVETHLTHVYAKLGIRSRTELARALAATGGEDGQSSGVLAIST